MKSAGRFTQNGGAARSGDLPAAFSTGLRTFSVNLPRTTLVNVLDAIIAAHGASNWDITFAEDGRPRIVVHAFDGWGTTM